MDKLLKEKMETLLKEKGIYSSFSCKTEEMYQIQMQFDIKSLDLYCPQCKENKTFIYQAAEKSDILGSYPFMLQQGVVRSIYKVRLISFNCPTCGKQILFVIYFDKTKAYKIAQYPSLMDVTRDELKEFDKSKLIDDSSYKEVYKAYECASSGFYVAAFTYMRRVYENLLLNLYKENQSEITVEEGTFEKLKFDKKLEMLKDYLAIEESIYKPLYSILSEGIHSLPEEECQKHFTLLKLVLLDILAEQKAKKEKAEKRKAMMDLFAEKKAEVKDND